MRHFVGRIQDQLESIHGVHIDAEVEQFLVSRERVERIRGHLPCAPEELLVLDKGDELELGLYLSPEVMKLLESRIAPLELLLGRGLNLHCAAIEGVSHWLYAALRAERDEQVSLLELEVQAEVDKFASCLLGLWQLGATRLSGLLRHRLFEGVEYFGHLGSGERDRYREANRLARHYAERLEQRFVLPLDLEGMLRELRRSFRLGGAEKYAHLGALGG